MSWGGWSPVDLNELKEMERQDLVTKINNIYCEIEDKFNQGIIEKVRDIEALKDVQNKVEQLHDALWKLDALKGSQ
jgi:hypothetical protein